MICKYIYYDEVTNKHLQCAGCGTVWKNRMLVDCPRCSGKGEERISIIPTFYRRDE